MCGSSAAGGCGAAGGGGRLGRIAVVTLNPPRKGRMRRRGGHRGLRAAACRVRLVRAGDPGTRPRLVCGTRLPDDGRAAVRHDAADRARRVRGVDGTGCVGADLERAITHTSVIPRTRGSMPLGSRVRGNDRGMRLVCLTLLAGCCASTLKLLSIRMTPPPLISASSSPCSTSGTIWSRCCRACAGAAGLGCRSEVLVVDGGSTDGTVDTAQGLGARVLVQTTPGTASAARRVRRGGRRVRPDAGCGSVTRSRLRGEAVAGAPRGRRGDCVTLRARGRRTCRSTARC